MKLKIAYTVFVVIITSAYAGQEELKIVKEKWINWADSMVASERDAFLKNHGLDSRCLNNTEIIELFKSHSEQRVKQEVASFRQPTYSFYTVVRAIKNLIFGIPEEVKNAEKNADYVKEITAEIFKHYNDIEIINRNCDTLNVATCRNYKNNRCYIFLNCEKYLKNIPQLKEVLMHEYSHIIHEDNLNEEIIQCVAWVNSRLERKEIENQTLSYHRACETRADVYAATTSPDHGVYLINFFNMRPDDTGVLSHPKTSDRVALLQKIKAELDAAQEE